MNEKENETNNRTESNYKAFDVVIENMFQKGYISRNEYLSNIREYYDLQPLPADYLCTPKVDKHLMPEIAFPIGGIFTEELKAKLKETMEGKKSSIIYCKEMDKIRILQLIKQDLEKLTHKKNPKVDFYSPFMSAYREGIRDAEKIISEYIEKESANE